MIHADDAAATLAAVVSAGRLHALAHPAVVEVLVPKVIDLVILEREVLLVGRGGIALHEGLFIFIGLRRHSSLTLDQLLLLLAFFVWGCRRCLCLYSSRRSSGNGGFHHRVMQGDLEWVCCR